jgi:hypothetical protein
MCVTGETAGELESLETLVKRCVEKWPPTLYLDHADAAPAAWN